MTDAGEITVNVRAKDAATGDDIPFASIQTFAVRCGPTQHDYQQGMDSVMEPAEVRYAALLYCRNCGDVITFAMPREDVLDDA